MRRTVRFLKWFVLLVILLPIAAGAALSYSRGWAGNWRTANWSSSGLLPEAASVTEARVMILAARTGRWKGIFAEHMSIVLKPAGAANWTRYDVVGWGNPVRRDNYPADAFWYGNRPRIIHSLAGAEAQIADPAHRDALSRAIPTRAVATMWFGRGLTPTASWLGWCGTLMASMPNSARLP